MSHSPTHTIIRNGSFVFNRRAPRAIQSDFGTAVARFDLGRDRDKASTVAERLTRKLDEIWDSPVVRPIEVSHLVPSVTPMHRPGNPVWLRDKI